MEHKIDIFVSYVRALKDGLFKTTLENDLNEAANYYVARGRYSRQFVIYINTWYADRHPPAKIK